MGEHGRGDVAVPGVVTPDLVLVEPDLGIASLPARAWQRLSVGAGAHGPREYDWARLPIRVGWAPGRGHWVLARRSISDPAGIAYYVCYGPRRSWSLRHSARRRFCCVASSATISAVGLRNSVLTRSNSANTSAPPMIISAAPMRNAKT